MSAKLSTNNSCTTVICITIAAAAWPAMVGPERLGPLGQDSTITSAPKLRLDKSPIVPNIRPTLLLLNQKKESRHSGPKLLPVSYMESKTKQFAWSTGASRNSNLFWQAGLLCRVNRHGIVLSKTAPRGLWRVYVTNVDRARAACTSKVFIGFIDTDTITKKTTDYSRTTFPPQCQPQPTPPLQPRWRYLNRAMQSTPTLYS